MLYNILIVILCNIKFKCFLNSLPPSPLSHVYIQHFVLIIDLLMIPSEKKSCVHINKAVDQNDVRKHFKNPSTNFLKCGDCDSQVILWDIFLEVVVLIQINLLFRTWQTYALS